MTTSILGAPSRTWRGPAPVRRGGSRMLRALLFTGCTLAVAVAWQLADRSAATRVDPDLVTLLRGMAALKTLMVAAAIGLLAWRLGRPVTTRVAMTYTVGAWLVSGATTMIWQLSSIGPSSATFHLGLLMLLVAAWRDEAPRGSRFALLRRRGPH